MLITWFPTDGLAEVIADDSLGRGAGSKACLDCWPDHVQLIQAVSRVRAASTQFYGRGNLSVTYHVQTRVEFASIADCMTYRDDVMLRVQGNGYLEISYDTGEFRTLAGAVCTRITFPERYGVSTVVDWEFTGESLT